MNEALARAGAQQLTPRPPKASGGQIVAVFGGLSALFGGLLIATQNWVFVPLLVASAGAAIAFLAQSILGRAPSRRRLPPPDAPPDIGMGASVAADAVLEPGSVVEMGASVRSGAVIRSGGLVRMGATVGAGARVERGAIVSWGATVRPAAVVGTNAIVGAGSYLGKGAHLPAGARLRPGAKYSAGWIAELLPARLPAEASAGIDPAEVRVATVCDRLEAELRASPERVRAFLGASDGTIASLRRTCEDLVRREKVLRTEVDAAALERLDEERKALGDRITSEPDEIIRRSLTGAVAAIDEQRRQRELLRLGANRLEAEQTRLLYTLEGLVSQFVRLRTAGAEAGRAPDAELEQSVKQLGTEIDAIADALEQVSRDVPVSGIRTRGG
jgi:carbonic anhydrase/acetyltransferase-like protein (isoleucine patch superfamily)